MYEYFPDNYTWSMSVMMTVNLGGNMSDIDEACAPLRDIAGAGDDAAVEAWHRCWSRIAERAEHYARANEAAGHTLSAGRKYKRACLYHMADERQLSGRDPRKIPTYEKMLACFAKFTELRREPVERVEIPFGDVFLPALLVRPAGVERPPVMVHFDGFDVMKEWIYMSGIAQELALRGIATLIVDHPGVGEALRLRGLHQIAETEKPAGACLDWLEGRDDVDASRAGIIALSLGGYFAPRAAAYEPRFKCCVAWGGNFNFGERWEERFEGTKTGEPSVSHIEDHFNWVFGRDSLEETRKITRNISLDGAVEKIACPILVTHGINDRQVTLWNAETTIERAVNSPRAELKVFDFEEGGAEHCQCDNAEIGIDFMADWIAEVLGGTLGGSNKDMSR